MTVYVDDFRAIKKFGRGNTWRMSHMIADTRDELDEIAERLDLHSRWKQNVGERKEHYDVTESMAQKAVRLGAKRISTRELSVLLTHRDLREYLGLPSVDLVNSLMRTEE